MQGWKGVHEAKVSPDWKKNKNKKFKSALYLAKFYKAYFAWKPNSMVCDKTQCMSVGMGVSWNPSPSLTPFLTCSCFPLLLPSLPPPPVRKSLNERTKVISHRRSVRMRREGGQTSTHAKGTFYCANTLSIYPVCSLHLRLVLTLWRVRGPSRRSRSPSRSILSRPKHSFLSCHCASRLHPSFCSSLPPVGPLVSSLHLSQESEPE